MVRWLTFNGIGLLGMALQLAILALLTRAAGVHYLAATIVAVEVTLLHNFAWHQRWTWRDRPDATARSVSARLARFHLLNGTVSIGGNLALMWLLTGRLGIDPLVANGLAVAACSLVNFAASHRLVFTAAQPRVPAKAIGAIAALACLSVVPLQAADGAATLQPATLAAWQAYERQVDDRYARATGSPFFAADAFAIAAGWRRDAIAGAVPMFQASAPGPGAKAADVPDGRIHHWVGAVFVRGVTVAAVVQSLETHAGQESASYDDVVASRLLGRDGDRLRVFLKLRRTKVITATYNTEHRVEYRRIGEQRASSRSVATRIAELADAGTASEREKPAGEDSGYLWRLNAYWRFEQTPDGVLIECESLSLSRSVPALLRPFISGIVEGVARESLEKTLVSLRKVLAG